MDFMQNAKENEAINIVVMRKEGDKKVEVKLSAPLFIPEIIEKNLLKPVASPTEAQVTLLKAWLSPASK
jgi:hypothetical protein